jgi:hypothetical protein
METCYRDKKSYLNSSLNYSTKIGASWPKPWWLGAPTKPQAIGALVFLKRRRPDGGRGEDAGEPGHPDKFSKRN